MGVDANYLYGFMAAKEKVEWDIDYLKEKFNLDEQLTGYLNEYTYGDLVKWLEDDEVDDWDDVEKLLGIKLSVVYDEQYLYFDHKDLFEKYPEGKFKDFKKLSTEYLKSVGVKNPEVFSWDEFGYFD